MRTIHKQALALQDVQTLSLPDNAIVRSIQKQGESLCVWYECDPKETEKVSRVFVIVGTGHPIPDATPLSYLATVQDGPFVWHVYEATK